MKRMTKKDGYGRATLIEPGFSAIDIAVNRLADYEDTMPLERAQELAQAEKDGRLAVLPPNDPLTPEELREMDGEPVWIVQEGELGRWAIVVGVSINCVYTHGCGTLKTRHCGKFWWAYTRRPEDKT